LSDELSSWLAAVKPAAEEGYSPPIKGCKAVIAPFVSLSIIACLHDLSIVIRHAGYSYSGPAAAWAYKSIDTTGMFVSLCDTIIASLSSL
jgi:MEMO1 family protein